MSETCDTSLVDRIRAYAPLIHCITNYVTAGDVANMILATGASPVMTDEVLEVEEMTSIAKALVLNIGTLSQTKVPAILAAGHKAAELGHPIIFDPVGCGATTYRTSIARQVLHKIPCTVIRGNVSEIRALFAGNDASGGSDTYVVDGLSHAVTQGVDANPHDKITEENVSEFAREAANYARISGAVVVMTGAIDVVAGCHPSGTAQVYLVRNGVSFLSRITGAGCMLDGVIAAYCATDASQSAPRTSDTTTWSVALAVAAIGLCGEQAYQQVQNTPQAGTGSMRTHFIDAMSHLTAAKLAQGMKMKRFSEAVTP